MINIDEIRKYYPNLRGTDKNILREYLQYKILDIIFKSPLSNKLSFLGGTAIKICYGSARYSEDLDFDNFGLSKEEFMELSEIIKRELELEGYKVEIKNVFKGAFRCYIKILEILQENSLSIARDEKITIQVDTTPHNYNYEARNFLLRKFDIMRTIKITPPDILLSMKMAAIFGRKRMKGRDFYDVIYLLGRTDFNYGYLSYKFGINNKKELKEKLLEFLNEANLKDMAEDVKPFLINLDDQEKILKFKSYMEQILT